jgi:hypothetical protein
MLGIETIPGNVCPRPVLLALSSSSKAKQTLARGNVEPSGEMSSTVFSNCSRAEAREYEDEHAATPIMPSVK